MARKAWRGWKQVRNLVNGAKTIFQIWTLGVMSIPGVALAGLMLLLAWLKVDRVLWGLLWIPVYVIIPFVGYRRFQRLKEREKNRPRELAWKKHKDKQRQLDERERLEQIHAALWNVQDSGGYACANLKDYFVKQLNRDIQTLGRIRRKEEWRLGLISAGHDKISRLGILQPTKRAVVFPKATFGRPDRIGVFAGGAALFTCQIMFPKEPGDLFNSDTFPLTAIKIKASGHGYRPIPLSQFLTEEGFPVLRAGKGGSLHPYFSTLASGVVFETPTGDFRAFRAPFFTQRVLIDDEGNVIWLGLDDGEDWRPMFFVPMRPANHNELFKVAYSKWSKEPALWYYTSPVPFDTGQNLPILDVPTTIEPLSTMVIDPFDPCLQSKLFVPRKDVNLEDMMQRANQLWKGTIAKCDGHLLRLTRDRERLLDYLKRKEELLGQYYLIEEIDLIKEPEDRKKMELPST